jgi:hypothetical protein
VPRAGPEEPDGGQAMTTTETYLGHGQRPRSEPANPAAEGTIIMQAERASSTISAAGENSILTSPHRGI